MRISGWSSVVCSSDLLRSQVGADIGQELGFAPRRGLSLLHNMAENLFTTLGLGNVDLDADESAAIHPPIGGFQPPAVLELDDGGPLQLAHSAHLLKIQCRRPGAAVSRARA